jgi:hypothetical protein
MESNGRNGNRGHLEIVPFEADKTVEGFMVFPGTQPTEIEVERTAENDHLFMYNHSSERFEVLRYGSALIVSLLRMYEPGADKLQTATSKRELALFSTSGGFHNHLLLREPLFPRETDSGVPNAKHTAFFDEIAGGEDWPLTIAVDDIYIPSLAKPPAEKLLDDI